MTQSVFIAVCAVIGAGLGIFNLIRSYLNDSERLKVAVWRGDEERYPNVEVVNCGPFRVTVVELGRVQLNGHVGKVVLDPRVRDEIPKRIEARDTYSFRVTLHEITDGVRYFYVRTTLGSVFTSETWQRAWLRRVREMTATLTGSPDPH